MRTATTVGISPCTLMGCPAESPRQTHIQEHWAGSDPPVELSSTAPRDKRNTTAPAAVLPEVAGATGAARALQAGDAAANADGSSAAPPVIDAALPPLHPLGAAAAAGVGLLPQAYPPAALAALGEQVLLDNLLHPGHRANAVVGVAAAHGKVDGAALAANPRKAAAQTAAFIAGELKDELTVLQALSELAALEAPSRRGLARSFLTSAGLAPGRPMNRDPITDVPLLANTMRMLRKVFRGSLWESAAQFYFEADRLTDADIQRMTGKPFDATALQQIHAKLPDSLKAQFDARYDSYATDYARVATRLLQAWITATTARQGISLADRHITVRRPQAQQYLKDTRVLAFEGPRNLGETRQEVTGHGYVVCIGAGDNAPRLFLSAQDGRAYRLPPGVTLAKWLHQNASRVFGVEMEPVSATGPLKWRMTSETVGNGGVAAMATWLHGGLYAEIEAKREQARGRTWNEAVAEFLLNAIPLRAAIVAFKKGDYLEAGLAASMDAMVVLPLLAEGVRATSLAARAVLPMVRKAMAGAGAAEARQAISADVSAELGTALHGALQAAPPAAIGAMAPLDLDRIAAALHTDYPVLAADLDTAAARARRMDVSGVWQPRADAAANARPEAAAAGAHGVAPADELTGAPQVVPFVNEAGKQMNLLPHGGEPGVYTEVSATGEPTGMVMMASGRDGGSVHPLLPLDTLQRYRIDAGRLRNATLVRPNAAEGTFSAANRQYVAVGADYLEVVPDRALSSGRTVWRVVTRPGSRADPVVHRLIHDRETGAWRRPDQAELGLQGGGAAQSARRRATVAPEPVSDLGPASTADFRELLLGQVRGHATPHQMTSFQTLLRRIESTRRGDVVLRALRAHHESSGALPQIVLHGAREAGAQAGAPAMIVRPSLAARQHTSKWHVDLDALRPATDQEAVDELAAVYNNMTGILESAYRSVRIAGDAPLNAQFEASCRAWIAEDEMPMGRRPQMGRIEQSTQSTQSTQRTQSAQSAQSSRAEARAARTRAVEALRRQLQELRNHGGITRVALRKVLRADTDEKVANALASGASVRLTFHSGLTSLPPIPAYVRVLDVSGSPIRDWRNLPKLLTRFTAHDCGLTRLPRNLSRTIKHLDISQNRLRKLELWEGLESMQMNDAALDHPLVLPDSIVDLEARNCEMAKLAVRKSSRLRNLNLRGSTVTAIKGPLPPGLETLNLSRCRALRVMPALRLPGLRHLNLSGIGLKRVPPLLPTLRSLNLSHNWTSILSEKLRLTPAVMELADCEIDVNFTGITQDDLPHLPPGQRGPRLLHLAGGDGAPAPSGRPIEQAVAAWFDPGVPGAAEVMDRWRQIAAAEGDALPFNEFRIFIDRLAGTVNAKDTQYGATFRAEVRAWLTECAQPGRKKLRQATFGACLDANESCQDRSAWTYTQLKSLRLNADIELGLYDKRVRDVVKAAREAFVKDELENLASRKCDAVDLARKQAAEAEGGLGAYYRPCDRIDIYLAYIVKLGDRAGIKLTGSRSMAFFNATGLTEAEIEADWPGLRLRLSPARFETFLSRDFSPWKSFMKRNFREDYEAAERAMQDTLEADVAEQLSDRIERLRIDQSDPASPRLVDEAVVDAGAQIQREIEDATYQSLTRRFLRAHQLEHLLTLAGAPGVLP